MPRRSKTRRRLLTAGLCAASVCSAHALERVTLQSGFSYDCSRHEPVDSSHVRLYLSGSGSTNYIDVSSTSIASVDMLPDPPPLPVLKTVDVALTIDDVPKLLVRAGAQHNIDRDLLAAVVKAESGGNAKAVSRAGARGLMQLMPGTAREHGVDDAFRADQNINGGTAYLDELLKRYHDDIGLALAAYNAGPAAVDRYHGIPPYRETRAYVYRVEREFIKRKAETAKREKETLTASAVTTPKP